MNKPMKAALLSAFICPGAGHFFLKKYILGTVLAGTAFAVLYLLISKTVERALQISAKIQSGEIQPDVAAIAELVSTQPTGAETELANIATAVLVIVWLIGIVDSYRVGRMQDEGVKPSGFNG